MTKLGELTLRLQKLYSKKFGNRDIVHIIKESGRVSTRLVFCRYFYHGFRNEISFTINLYIPVATIIL